MCYFLLDLELHRLWSFSVTAWVLAIHVHLTRFLLCCSLGVLNRHFKVWWLYDWSSIKMKHCSLEEIVYMHKSLKSNLLATLCACCGVWLNLRQDLRSLNGSEVCKGLGSENPTCLVGKRRVKAWVHSLEGLSWTLILCTYKSFWFHWSTYVKLNKSACAQVKCLLLILQGLWLPLWSITPCKPLLLSLILCVCVPALLCDSVASLQAFQSINRFLWIHYYWLNSKQIDMWKSKLQIYWLTDLIIRNFQSYCDKYCVTSATIHRFYAGAKPNCSVFYQHHEPLLTVHLARVALKKVNKL